MWPPSTNIAIRKEIEYCVIAFQFINWIEAEPCEHDITVEYADGSKKTKPKEVEAIVNKYGPYLNKDVSNIDCFASFFSERSPVTTDCKEPGPQYNP